MSVYTTLSKEFTPVEYSEMTLRDYFAAKVAEGMFAADTETWWCDSSRYIIRARSAYEMADAMLKARKEAA